MQTDDRSRWRSSFERHAVLVGRLATVAAIFAASLLGYVKPVGDQRSGVDARISLIGNTVSQFDPLVQEYIKLALEKDSKVAHYYRRQVDDPRVERMVDFQAMPASQWPSREVYHAFNEYLFSSIMLMETSADEHTSIKLQDRITAYGEKFERLRRALDGSRR